MRQEDPLGCEDGIELYGEAHLVKRPRSHVVIVHGYGEHCGRYEHVAKVLNAAGHSVYCHDHRGHGHSPGLMALVVSADTLVADLALQIRRVKGRAGEMPVFVLAHSMGAGIAVKAALTYPLDVRGYLFSGPIIKISKDISPLLQKIAPVLGRMIPKIPVGNAGGSALLSRDVEVCKRFDADPLCYKGLVRARTGAELLKLAAWCERHLEEFHAPFLIAHGEADKLADIAGSKAMIARAQSEDKQILSFPGMEHEIMNEIGKEQVFEQMQRWIDARIP